MLFGGFACTPENGEEDGNSYPEITVSPASISATLEGATETLVVTSNTGWIVSCDQQDVVLSTLMGNRNSTVTVEIPATTTARNFVIKFVASKMVSVAGISVPSTKEFDVQVSQNATGTDLNTYAYYEDCGTDVEKDGSYWPYVDAFTGWNPQGDAAAAVTYGGNNASVRASGTNYQPTEDAIGLTGQQYVFLNKVPASAHFLINNIAVKGGTQYVFTFNVSCQNSYANSLPGFATVTNDLVHLELSYDGTTWANVNFTATPNGGNGWYATTTEFKTKADATKLYARFTYEAPASNGGGRFDDFKLVEGGNGGELDFGATPEPPVAGEEGTISAIVAAGNYTVNNAWVIATYAQGFLMTDSSNAIILVYQGNADGVVVPAVGQVVNVSGAVTLYGGLLQFGKDATVEQVAGETKSVTYPTPTTLNYSDIVSYVSNPSIIYAEMKGKLVVKDSGKGYNNYNIELQSGTDVKGSVSYPAAELEATMDALADKWVVVRGYMIGKPNSNAYYANMMALEVVETEAPEGGETPENPGQGETPETPAVGDYNFFSDDAFVDSSQNYSGRALINGSTTENASGFKIGTSSKAGYFASKALGVTGDKTLEFYAVAWNNKTCTLYVRIKGQTDILGQFTLVPNTGCANSAPYTMTLTSADYYTVSLPGVTEDTVLEFASDPSFSKDTANSNARCVVMGAHVK